FAVPLGAALLGDVLSGSDELGRLAIVADHDLSVRLDHALLAIRPYDPVPVPERLALRERCLYDLVDTRPLVRMHVLEEAVVAWPPSLRIEAEDPVELLGPRDLAGGEIPFPAADVGELLCLGELPL